MLNLVTGPSRTPKQWVTTWKDARTRALQLKSLLLSEKENAQPLSDLQMRILRILGKKENQKGDINLSCESSNNLLSPNSSSSRISSPRRSRSPNRISSPRRSDTSVRSSVYNIKQTPCTVTSQQVNSGFAFLLDNSKPKPLPLRKSAPLVDLTNDENSKSKMSTKSSTFAEILLKNISAQGEQFNNVGLQIVNKIDEQNQILNSFFQYFKENNGMNRSIPQTLDDVKEEKLFQPTIKFDEADEADEEYELSYAEL